MEVNSLTNEYNRDIEALRRRLQEREEDQQREIDELRRSQKEKIEDLEEQHSETVKKNKEKNDAEVESAIRESRERTNEASDRYQKNIGEMRREHYNKLGKIERENLINTQREKHLREQQIDDFLSSQKRDTSEESKIRDQQSDRARQKYLENQRALENYYDNKLDKEKASSEAERMEMARKSREKVDKNISETREELGREKIGAEIRLKNYVKEKELEKDLKDKSTFAREQDLLNKYQDAVSGSSGTASRTIQEQKNRYDSEIQEMLHNNNMKHSLKNQKQATDIASMQHETNQRMQDKQNLYMSSEKELKSKINQLDTQRSEELERLSKRHRQELYNQQENLKSIQNRSQEEMGQQHSQSMLLAKRKNEDTINTQREQTNSTLQKLQDSNTFQLNDLKNKSHKEISDLEYANRKYSKRLAEEYQAKQNVLEEQRSRQLSDQEFHHKLNMEKMDSNKNAFVAENSREAQLKVFQANEMLKNRSSELIASHESERDRLENLHKSQSEKMRKTYSDSVNHQKNQNEESTAEMQYANRMRMSKLQSDNNHESTMRMIELQNKNRELMESYESKISNMREEHQAELNRIKSEADKMNRDLSKRTKETMDRERDIYKRQLETKDQIIEDKLKLQADAFRDQIERLKKTQNASLKTS